VLQKEPKEELGISPNSESQRDRPMVTAVVTWRKWVCVCIVVLGNHKDPKIPSNSIFQMIQDREVEHPFGGNGVCAKEFGNGDNQKEVSMDDYL
jgi:hypothetical protein